MSSKSAPGSSEEFLPIWFKLKPAFYTRLKKLADETGVSMPEVLTKALREYERRLKGEARNGASVSQKAKGSPAALSALRWQNVPADERKKIARELAEKRWAGNRQRKSTK